jgi:hypothetical protein
VDHGRYRFFQLTRSGGLRWSKDYPEAAFDDHDHFLAVMLKYLLPATIFIPPAALDELNRETLERLMGAENKKRELPD